MVTSFTRKYPTVLVYILFCIPIFGAKSLDTFVFSYWFYKFEGDIAVIVVSIVMFIFRIVSIFLYPIIGSLSDRNFPFTRTLGKRFPWIVISGVLTPILFVILIWLPVLDQGIFWVVFFVLYLLYAIAFSLYITSYYALLFTKFRNPKERIFIGTITELLSAIMVFIVFFAPIHFDVRGASIAVALFFIIPLFIGILGLREEEELINTYFSPNQAPKERVFKGFLQKFTIFKNKNFLILLSRFIVISISNFLFLILLNIYSSIVLNASSIFRILLDLVYIFWFIIGILAIFLPSWFLGHLNAYRVSGLALGIALVAFFFFADNILTAFIFIGIIGFTYGLETASLIPIIGDVFDEHAVISRKHSEGFYYGILTTFATMGVIIAPIIMVFFYSFLELLPISISIIKIVMTLIPGIPIILVMILFTLFFDLKPDKTEAIRMELKELEL